MYWWPITFYSIICSDVAALVFLWLASGMSWSEMMIQFSSLNLPAGIIIMEKFFLAFPLTYHTFNGVRHLVSHKTVAYAVLY